jgi:hypothetical protein
VCGLLHALLIDRCTAVVLHHECVAGACVHV